MLRRSRIKSVASIWVTAALALTLAFWMFLRPQIIAHHSGATCNAVQPGMSLQQALIAIEAGGDLHYERLDGNALNVDACEITLNNGKVIKVTDVSRPDMTEH